MRVKAILPGVLALVLHLAVTPLQAAEAEEAEEMPAGVLGQADGPTDEQADEAQLEDGVRVSRREASDRVREAYEGRILSIRREGDQWRVRLDNNGTVFNLLVNVTSGELSRPDE